MSDPLAMNRLLQFAGPSNTETLTSALDNVMQGIAASPGGISNIDNIIKSFSPGDVAHDDFAGVPSMQGAAEIERPASYLEGIGESIYKEKSLVPFSQLMTNLNDPEFDAGQALQKATENLFGGEGITQNLAGKEGLLGTSLAGINFGYVSPDSGESEAISTSPSALSGLGEKAIIIVGGKQDEGFGDKLILQKTESIGEQFIIPIDNAPDPEGRPELNEKFIIPINSAPDPETPEVGKSLIWKSGPEQAPLKPAEFLEFDESLRALFDVDPFTDEGKQLLSDFRNQLQALINMESSVQRSADLYRQLDDSSGAQILE